MVNALIFEKIILSSKKRVSLDYRNIKIAIANIKNSFY